MSKAMKGVLLSGLVLPGLGQIVLKSYLRGVVFMLAAVVGLATVMIKAGQAAMAIVEKIGPASGNLDINQMITSTHQAIAEANTVGYKLAIVVILFAWLYSAVDAYLIGRRLDLRRAKVASKSDIREGKFH